MVTAPITATAMGAYFGLKNSVTNPVPCSSSASAVTAAPNQMVLLS